MRRKIIFYNLTALAGILAGFIFAQVVGVEKFKIPMDYKSKYAVYESSIAKKDCYLCAENPDSPITQYLGEENIGIINLNTFDCFRFEVNRYNESKELIEKLVKYGTSQGWRGDKDNGSTFEYSVFRNRGYITATVRFNRNSDLQLDRIQKFLCSDCMDNLMEDYSSDERHRDIALVDFMKHEIKPLTEGTTGFSLSDYYVSMRYDAEYDNLYLTAFYSPIRYSEYGYPLDLSVIEEIIRYCSNNNFDFTPNDEVTEFLNGFERISGIHSNDERVTFMNEPYIGTKQFTVYKNRSYDILDFEKERKK